jgi:hypothetical protein
VIVSISRVSYPVLIDADDLYSLPLEEFTAARNQLAKELAASGDKDASTAVKQMKKPSRAAWAINQVARRHPKDVEQLLAAGDKLHDAQDAALRGDASKLRTAGRDVSEALDAVAERAEPLSPAVRDAVRETLRVAAVDPAGRELLKSGTLIAELESGGFGLEGLELPADFEVKRAPRGPDPHLVVEAERAEARARRLLEAADAAETRAREARLAAEQAVADAEAARAAIK